MGVNTSGFHKCKINKNEQKNVPEKSVRPVDLIRCTSEGTELISADVRSQRFT